MHPILTIPALTLCTAAPVNWAGALALVAFPTPYPWTRDEDGVNFE